MLEEVCKRCDICLRYKRTPERPVAGMPLAVKFNEVLSMDVGELNGRKFIVLLDWNTGYTQGAWLKRKTPNEVIEIIMERWVCYFGAPKKILTDGGREFQNEEVEEFTERWGIELMSTSAESPWSNGKCEKAVGVMKEGMRKLLDEKGVNEKWVLNWMLCAKNERIGEDGFSPKQKVLGRCGRGERCWEDKGPGEVESEVEGECLEKIMKTQVKVNELCNSGENRRRIRKALRHRIRKHPIEEAREGDRVYYKKQGEQKWRGPGKVIGRDGKTVVIKHGSLLRNVNRIHITRIKKGELQVNENERKEESIEDNEIKERRVEYQSSSESDSERTQGRVVDEESMTEQESSESGESEDEKDEDERSCEREDIDPQMVKIKVGQKYEIREKDEGGEWKRITVMSRGGKATGKWKDCFNVQEENSDAIYWIDTRRFEMKLLKEMEEEEEGNEVMLCERLIKKEIEEAKEREIESWRENDVFEEVEWTEGMKVIKTRWIITEKMKEGKKFCKARLVAKGFMEREEEVPECEAPTCATEGLKVVLGIIKMNGWEVRTMDIKTAYLQGDLIERDVYIVPPIDKNRGMVWKLKKAVYGLKDAARKWYDSLVQILRETGGNRSFLDSTVMKWKERGKLIGIMVMHVDDLCYGGNSYFLNRVIRGIKERLKVGSEERGRFKYLGVQIEDGENGITMSQRDYVERSIERIDVCGEDERELNEKEMTGYRSKLGQLNWVAKNTRPDISFGVSMLGRRMKRAQMRDMKKLGKVIKQMKKRMYDIRIGRVKEGDKILEVYTDASFGNVDGIKTQIGFYICLRDSEGNNVPLMWKSQVAKRVIGSTLAAETMSTVMAVEWAEYIKCLWEEIQGGRERLSIMVKTDCKSLEEAIKSVNGVKNRMLRIELANMKSKMEDGTVKGIEWVEGERQLADVLTKERVSGVNWERFQRNLGGGV